MVKHNWLWDVKADEKKVVKILKNEHDPRFIMYASMLFSRNNDEAYVFRIIDKKLFCQYWPLIRKKIDQTGWFSPFKSDYWQPVYKKVLNELRAHGINIHEFPAGTIDKQRFYLAREIRRLREKEGYTQQEAAKFLGVKQQFVSKLETGRINPSLETIGKIANLFGKNLEIHFR
jgi:DNA-binding XRE family transcriptional regulator